MTERVIFLQRFKSIPWQIIESLQICYDNGDDIIKKQALRAGDYINRYNRIHEVIYEDAVNKECRCDKE